MAVTLSNTFEGGTDTVGITAGNSGGASGNAFDVMSIGTSGSCTYSATSPIKGSLSGVFTIGGTSNKACGEWTTSLGTVSRIQGSCYIQPLTMPTAARLGFLRFAASGAQCARISLGTDGKLYIIDTANSVQANTTAAMTTSDKWYLTYDITFGATGAYTFNVYESLTATSPTETFSGTANFNTSANEFDVGIAASTINTSIRLDNVIVTDQGIPGAPLVSATVAAPLGALSDTDTGKIIVKGTDASPLGVVTASFGGKTSLFRGTLAAPLGGLTMVAKPTRQGTLAAPLGGLTGVFHGTAGTTPVQGLLSAPLGGLTATFHGSATIGTLHPTLGALGVTLAGTYVVRGTMSAPLGGLSLHSFGGQSEHGFFFTPPQRIQVTMMRGSLRYSYPVSETVWKDANGVWQHQETPPGEVLDAASVLLAVSGRPQVVSAAIAAELQAAGIGTITEF